MEAAVEKKDVDVWGDKGYVLTENGEHVWGDLSREIAKKAEELGFIKGKGEKPLDKDEALEQAGFEAVSWGLNSRGKAGRAEKELGWKAKEGSIEAEIEGILRDEKERLANEKA